MRRSPSSTLLRWHNKQHATALTKTVLRCLAHTKIRSRQRSEPAEKVGKNAHVTTRRGQTVELGGQKAVQSQIRSCWRGGAIMATQSAGGPFQVAGMPWVGDDSKPGKMRWVSKKETKTIDILNTLPLQHLLTEITKQKALVAKAQLLASLPDKGELAHQRLRELEASLVKRTAAQEQSAARNLFAATPLVIRERQSAQTAAIPRGDYLGATAVDLFRLTDHINPDTLHDLGGASEATPKAATAQAGGAVKTEVPHIYLMLCCLGGRG